MNAFFLDQVGSFASFTSLSVCVCKRERGEKCVYDHFAYLLLFILTDTASAAQSRRAELSYLLPDSGWVDYRRAQ